MARHTSTLLGIATIYSVSNDSVVKVCSRGVVHLHQYRRQALARACSARLSDSYVQQQQGKSHIANTGYADK